MTRMSIPPGLLAMLQQRKQELGAGSGPTCGTDAPQVTAGAVVPESAEAKE